MAENITEESALTSKLASGGIFLVYIWASFHEACKEGGQMDQILQALLTQYPQEIQVLKCNAEDQSIANWASSNDVTSVPSVLFFKAKAFKGKVEGVNPAELTKILDNLVSPENLKNDITRDIEKELETESLRIRLRKLIDCSKVMIFMKGTADEPKCKFSRALMEIIKPLDINFETFNILEDNDVRQGLKTFSNWKTYPQVYVNGKLLGGLDSVKDLVENGMLETTLSKGIKFEPVGLVQETTFDNLDDRLEKLISQARVMLFMKGDPTEPRCGFSQKIVGILESESIEFQSFDILEDKAVREGLKTFSNWPTYPQLYVNGDLIGGLDIVQEMSADGDLKDQLGLD